MARQRGRFVSLSYPRCRLRGFLRWSYWFQVCYIILLNIIHPKRFIHYCIVRKNKRVIAVLASVWMVYLLFSKEFNSFWFFLSKCCFYVSVVTYGVMLLSEIPQRDSGRISPVQVPILRPILGIENCTLS